MVRMEMSSNALTLSQNFALLLPSPATISLFLSLWVSSREAPGPSIVHVWSSRVLPQQPQQPQQHTQQTTTTTPTTKQKRIGQKWRVGPKPRKSGAARRVGPSEGWGRPKGGTRIVPSSPLPGFWVEGLGLRSVGLWGLAVWAFGVEKI